MSERDPMIEMMMRAVDAERLDEQKDVLRLGEMIYALQAKTASCSPHAKMFFRRRGTTEEYAVDGVDPHSYRGYYSDLALELDRTANMDAAELHGFIAMLEGVKGKTMHGYKGGDYLMHKNVPVWFSAYGSYSGDGFVDVVIDNQEKVVLEYQQFD